MDGMRKKEYLGLYLVPENTRADKIANRATMRIAEEIKAKRLVELIEGKVTFAGGSAAKVNLLEWLEQQREYYYDHDNMNYSRTIRNLMRHIELFSRKSKSLTMKDVTPAFLRRFLDYLYSDGANK